MAQPIREAIHQSGANFGELVAIMQRLLSKDGCPWDREQSLQTLKPFLIEEAHEVLEAIDAQDPEGHREELGDLLFQIVFQSELRAAEGAFGIEDVVAAIARKMVRRHPHVFGDLKVSGSEEVLANWGKLKAEEHAEQGKRRATLDGVPQALPSLLRAQRIGEKAAAVGFDWPDLAGVRAKVTEELGELDEAIASGDAAAIGEELGDLLFVLTRIASWCKVDAEGALAACIRRFRGRFEDMESRAGRPLPELSLAEMDLLWRDAKRRASELPKK
ncbi:MAG: nucleoside triphosphate pyrophosphohydrolase [Myxococcales bacterium]|nr:nucleoside triphosphate pyrophosphohydrolase [Myxococcales bacterium]